MALDPEREFVFAQPAPRAGHVGIVRRVGSIVVEAAGWLVLLGLSGWIAVCAATIVTPTKRGEITVFSIVLVGEAILSGVVCVVRPMRSNVVRRSASVRRTRLCYTIFISMPISVIAFVTAMLFSGIP